MPLAAYLRRVGLSFLIVSCLGFLAGLAYDALSGEAQLMPRHALGVSVVVAMWSFLYYLVGRSHDWVQSATEMHYVPRRESSAFVLLLPLFVCAVTLAGVFGVNALASAVLGLHGVLAWAWAVALGAGLGVHNLVGSTCVRSLERESDERFYAVRASPHSLRVKRVVVARRRSPRMQRGASRDGASVGEAR